MERRQARTMRIYSERKWKKSVPDSEYSCDVMCTSLFNRNRLGILGGHTDLAFDACRYGIYA